MLAEEETAEKTILDQANRLILKNLNYSLFPITWSCFFLSSQTPGLLADSSGVVDESLIALSLSFFEPAEVKT
jgi:hypothetical protein